MPSVISGRVADNRRRYREHNRRIFNVVEQSDPTNILQYLHGVAQSLDF